MGNVVHNIWRAGTTLNSSAGPGRAQRAWAHAFWSVWGGCALDQVCTQPLQSLVQRPLPLPPNFKDAHPPASLANLFSLRATTCRGVCQIWSWVPSCGEFQIGLRASCARKGTSVPYGVCGAANRIAVGHTCQGCRSILQQSASTSELSTCCRLLLIHGTCDRPIM